MGNETKRLQLLGSFSGGSTDDIYVLNEGETIEDVPEEAVIVIDPYSDANVFDGYYKPAISQPNDSTVVFSFSPTKDGMAAVTPISINLPAGPKGDSFTYEDFTTEQLESLRGPKGDSFTYEDFTTEQLEALRGPNGDDYVLTEADKIEIAELAAELVDIPDSGGNADLTDEEYAALVALLEEE